MCHETETSQADIARALGVSATKISRWADPEARETPTVADVTCMPEACRLWYLRRDAEQLGQTVAPRPDVAGGVDTWLQRLASLGELHDVMPLLAEALSDGHLDPQELAAMERQATKAMTSLVGLINAVKAARREHGVLVPLDAGRPA